MIREKIGQINFFAGKFAFFSKPLFSTTSQVLQNWSFTLHSNWQKTLWTFKNCPLGFVTLERARKNRSKSLLHWKDCLFFHLFCFQQPLRYYRNDLVTSTLTVGLPFGTLLLVPWRLSHSTMRKKNRSKTFLHWKDCLFLLNFFFVFDNLLGVTEMIL